MKEVMPKEEEPKPPVEGLLTGELPVRNPQVTYPGLVIQGRYKVARGASPGQAFGYFESWFLNAFYTQIIHSRLWDENAGGWWPVVAFRFETLFL